jgi:hypothetical protein
LRAYPRSVAAIINHSIALLLNQRAAEAGALLASINPKALAKYRESACVSGAKDDPSDAALLMDLIYRHRDRS